jgi:hypothetical protein
MATKLKFPESFIKRTHLVVPGASQWLATKPNGVSVSVVGGGIGLYGNGVTTFEMWDGDEDEPRGYLTIEQINEHLANN